MYPTDRFYTKDHEWILISGATARVGITDYAQAQLGDVVYVELPEVGRQLDEGTQFGSIESVKAVSDLYCPLAGRVDRGERGPCDGPRDGERGIPTAPG